MGNIVLQIPLPLGQETVLAIEALQMSLCPQPDAVSWPARLTCLHRLADQLMAKTIAPCPRRRNDPADGGAALIADAGAMILA